MRNRPMTRRDERGATLVIASVFIIVAVIMVAAVVDLGGLRAEKKEVTLSTDAASLAAVAAIDYSDPNATGNGTDCADVRSVDAAYPTVEDVADRYLTENGQSVLGTCQIFFGTAGGNETYLTVEASDNVEFAFGKAIGQEGGSTGGVSSARAGSASIGGIYPIGVCGPDSPGVDDFVNPALPFPQQFAGSETVTLDFGNSNCGGSGNHDQIDFEDGYSAGECKPTSEGAFCTDIKNGGFGGIIPPIITSNPGGGGWNGQGLPPPLHDLRNRQVHFFVPVVGNCSEVPEPERRCSGNGTTYPVKYLMEVVIDSFVPNGGGAGFTFDVYQVVDYQYYKDNGLPVSTVNQEVGLHICATTADTSGCTNNPIPSSPPPPPPPPAPCTVSTVVPNPPSPVSVTSAGALLSDLVVDVTVVDVDDCDTPTVALRAVGPVTVSAPTPPPPAGNTYTFTYAGGTPFSPVSGSVFDLEFSERGVVRDDGTSITTVAPSCAVTDVQPLTQTVPVTGKGNPRTTTEQRSWTITITKPELCGTISGQLVGPSSLALSPPSSSASATMTLTLDVGAGIAPGDRGKSWSVRILSTSGATTTLISNTSPQNSATIVIG